MKFSKESHRKTGVGVNAKDGTIGLLYRDPLIKEETIEEVIKNRTNSTKRLYNLFGTGEGNRNISKEAKEVAKTVNRAITSLKGNKKKEIKERITGQLSVDQFVDALNRAAKQSFLDKYVNEALDSLLKKNFRTKETKDALRILLVCSLVEKKKLSDEQKDKIRKCFIKKLVDDYNKTSEKKHMQKALENQNMVIQPSADSKCLVIAETKRSKENKTSEKDSFRMFLLDYASLEESVRHEMRVKLRRLVDLYFYGKDAVIEDDFDEWKDHAEKKQETGAFVKKVVVTKKDRNGKIVESLNVDETIDAIRTKNIACYRESLSYTKDNKELFFEDDVLNKFWIHHIESEVERIYKRINNTTGDYKFELGYLSEKVWKGIINYLSIKYIAEGKAVYHYCMNALSDDNKTFGILDERYKNGITSFEYERIKAEETLQRESAISVSFAANHLANATVNLDEKNSDFLLIKNLEDVKKPHVVKNFLQFFGGASAWADFDFSSYDELKVLEGFKEAIYSLRNTTFHFDTKNKDQVKWDTNLIGAMFSHDCKMAGKVQKDKMYSNNVSDFYSEENIKKALETLYSDIHERASQVPSFNKVFVRKNFPVYLKEQKLTPNFESAEMQKWQSAVYYLYKEIYYNAFLQDKKSYELLKNFVYKLPENEKDDKGRKTQESAANANFKEAFSQYEKEASSLSAICQLILTEYNNQNKGNRKAISARTGKADELIFQHYKMILLKGLETAFTEYVKQNSVYDFIKNPTILSNVPSQDDFLTDYKTLQFEDLSKKVKETPDLQKWYIVGRLINPKQLNQLIGSFRSYEQYVNDVTRRAKQTKNPLIDSEISVDVHGILDVLSVCASLSGVVSNNWNDYFESEDAYAEYIAKFVDYGIKNNSDMANATLAQFCKEIGIYHDGTNPIVNRNVILCKLFGSSDILSKAGILKVDEAIIKKYKTQEKEIAGYQTTGICKDKAEQEKLKKFQELKNLVELRNIVEYTEILNELQGQLINWSYFRERDLMHFQLGFHYICLQKNGKDILGYNKAGDVTGAILYQIVAMYTNGIPMIDKDGKSDDKGNLQTSGKLNRFASYSESVNGDKWNIYLSGLELFENIDEHDQCVKLRNDIDHFHYFSDQNRSMLDYYSEVFDRFFTYDMKYTKNVANMMYNILLSHLVVATFGFGKGDKEVGEGKNKVTKPRASIVLKTNGLASEKFTYKFSDGKTISLCARSNDFLRDVAALLYYPEMPPADVCRDTVTEDKQAKPENSKSNVNGINHSNGPKGVKTHYKNTSNAKRHTGNSNNKNSNDSKSINSSAFSDALKKTGWK